MKFCFLTMMFLCFGRTLWAAIKGEIESSASWLCAFQGWFCAFLEKEMR